MKKLAIGIDIGGINTAFGLVDENGVAVILKNNVPRYVLVEFSQMENEQTAEDEDVLTVSRRLIAKNRHAYEELAK